MPKAGPAGLENCRGILGSGSGWQAQCSGKVSGELNGRCSGLLPVE